MSSKQIQDIYQYIQTHGNFLSSQKVLKQIQKHPQTIWEIIVRLCSCLKNRNIQNAYAQMVFMLEQPEKHQRSAKWLKDFMDINDLAKKLETNYNVWDFFKPDRQKILHFITKIIQVSKGIQQLVRQNDNIIVKDQIMSKQLTKHKNQQQTISQQLEELKEKKRIEHPLYEQKVKKCEQLNKEINSKRQMKLDQISRQKNLQDDHYQKQKLLQDLKFKNEGKFVQIQQLKKQISQNAPQVKKQKRAIEQEYHNVSKTCYLQMQLAKNRQSLIFNSLIARNRFKDLISDLVTKNRDVFQTIDQSRSKLNKQKQENQRLSRSKNQLFRQQTELKQQIQTIQIESFNENIIVENQKNQISQHQGLFREKSAQMQMLRKGLREYEEKSKKIQALNKSIKQKIQSIRQTHESKKKELQEKRKEWNEKMKIAINDFYLPIQNEIFG